MEAAGPVIVKVDGRESNKTNLTDWRGDFDYTLDPGMGSLAVDFDMELHWRADVREYRAGCQSHTAGSTLLRDRT